MCFHWVFDIPDSLDCRSGCLVLNYPAMDQFEQATAYLIFLFDCCLKHYLLKSKEKE